MLSRQFLIQMAQGQALSPEQEALFLLRFGEEKDYKAIAQHLQISERTCLKRMGEVYKKFGIEGVTRGKENRLRDLLIAEIESSQGVEESVALLTGKILLSYRPIEPDQTLAQQLQTALTSGGYIVLMLEERTEAGNHWLQSLEAELSQCDRWLLLWSPHFDLSDEAIKKIKQVKKLHNVKQKPDILTICIDFPVLSLFLNDDLRRYLNGVTQLEWRSPDDTPTIVQAVLNWLARESLITNGELEKTEEPKNRKESDFLNPKVEQSPSYYSDKNQNYSSLDLPITIPLLPEGQLDLNSALYIERFPIESRCYETILQPGSLIWIKAPGQMGKTSLIAKVLHQAETRGYRIVTINFQLADRQILSDLNRLLQWFCAYISLELKLPEKLSDYWHEVLGGKVNSTVYLEKYILTEINSPVVLALDEGAPLFEHPEIAAEFFNLLKIWHEQAKKDKIWKKLRLLVVHSPEISNFWVINSSPFTVGLSVELPGFTKKQVQNLIQRYELNWSEYKIEKLTEMVGGHPFLIQLALYHIARQDITLEELLETAPTDAGLYSDHLRQHLWNLQQHPELAEAMKKVAIASQPVRLESIHAFKLHSMGLVHLQGNEVIPHCDLYRQYFRERLGGSDET